MSELTQELNNIETNLDYVEEIGSETPPQERTEAQKHRSKRHYALTYGMTRASKFSIINRILPPWLSLQ